MISNHELLLNHLENWTLSNINELLKTEIVKMESIYSWLPGKLIYFTIR